MGDAAMGEKRLLSDVTLEGSSVVANCAMNRERQLTGVNSYSRELGFNPLDWLTQRAERAERAERADQAWLDLCCGTGRPLVQAADRLSAAGLRDGVELVGVDLVDHFDDGRHGGPTLICASAAAWSPARTFD